MQKRMPFHIETVKVLKRDGTEGENFYKSFPLPQK